MALRTLRKLLQRRRASPADPKRADVDPKELQGQRDLLERVAAGLALNKTPGR